MRRSGADLRGRRSASARSGADFVCLLARSGTDFVAGAALSQGQVQISWQTQYFRKVRYRCRGRRSTLARWACGGGIEFTKKSDPLRVLVGLRECQPPLSRRLSCLARVRHGFGAGAARVRRPGQCDGSAKVSQGSDCVAGAALSQGQVQILWQA